MSRELQIGLVSLVKNASPQTSAAKRIHTETPQEPIYPMIRYQRVDTNRVHALDQTVGVTEATVQLDCMAASSSAAWKLADELRVLLHGYRGAFGTLTAHLVSLDTENEFHERDGDRVDHWVSQRYRIWTDMD